MAGRWDNPIRVLGALWPRPVLALAQGGAPVEDRSYWEQFLAGLRDSLPRAEDLAGLLVRAGVVLTITLIAFLLARQAKGWTARLLGRSRVSPNIIALAGNSAFLLALVFGFVWIIQFLGAHWSVVLANLSIVTVALGLALQDLLKNLAAGIYILLEQPFKIGDRINVKGVTGTVEGIDIRTTVVRTDDGIQVLVPNTIVFTEVITNHSAYDTRRVAIQLQELRTPFKDLSRAVNDALAPFEEIERHPAPRVTIQKLNDDGTSTVAVEYWQRGDPAILPDVLDRLNAAFPEADIAILATGDGAKPAGATA
jgi:small conductance mechanosensitive channel